MRSAKSRKRAIKLISLGEEELRSNKLNFYFSYTNKDWRLITQAIEVNHTIDVLKNLHINENTKKIDLNNRAIKDITPILGLVNLKTVNLSENQLVDVSGLSLFAEWERNIIKERTRAGLEAPRVRGKIGGRPKIISSDKIRAARSLYNKNESSVSEICKLLKISERSFYRYRTDKNYQ